jgi:hypothetical protein
MNLGIDIDGTASRYPEFFVTLGRRWREAGDKVFIITGLGLGGVESRRGQFPFLDDQSWYDRIVTTAEYNDSERALIGKVESNEFIVGRFKQRMCKELGVGIMFDDQALIHRAFGDIPIFEVR